MCFVCLVKNVVIYFVIVELDVSIYSQESFSKECYALSPYNLNQGEESLISQVDLNKQARKQFLVITASSYLAY